MSRLTALEKRTNAYAATVNHYKKTKQELAQQRTSIRFDEITLSEEKWCEVILAQQIIDSLTGVPPDLAVLIAEYASEHCRWGEKEFILKDIDGMTRYKLRPRCWCRGGWFDRKPVEILYRNGIALHVTKIGEDRILLRDCIGVIHDIDSDGGKFLTRKPRGLHRFMAYFRWFKKMTPSEKEWESIRSRFSGLDSMKYFDVCIEDEDLLE